MLDEIGHVRVRLFRRNNCFELNSIAYMGRALNEDESKRLVKLWNDIDLFLRTRAESHNKQNETDNEN